MAGPWERYQAAEPEKADGPWSKYAAAPSDATAGEQVYEHPVGPEQADLLDRMKERVQDPARWQAILKGTGTQAPDVVQGEAPLALPAAALPASFARLAAALNATAPARIATAVGQGALQRAAMAPEGHRLEEAVKGAELSGGIQGGLEALPAGLGLLGKGAAKVGSALTGKSESAIGNLFNHSDEVGAMMKNADSNGSIPIAADSFRERLQAAIRAKRAELSKAVQDGIAAAPKKPSVPGQSIIDALEEQKAKLDPHFHAGAIREIESAIAQAKQGLVPEGFGSKTGLTNAKYLDLIKRDLQGRARGSYAKDGEIFVGSTEAAQAAKQGGRVARKVFNEAAPEAGKANAGLEILHKLEDKLNPNLIAPGTSDSALFSAASNPGSRNALMLNRLGKQAGMPVMDELGKLNAAREFAKPGLLPSYATGKSLTAAALGAGVGYAVDGKEGAGIGALAASPLAWKYGIQGASFAKDLAAPLSRGLGAARANPVVTNGIANAIGSQFNRGEKPEPMSSEGKDKLFKLIQQNPEHLKLIRDPMLRTEFQKKLMRSPGSAVIPQEDAQKAFLDGN